VYKANVKAKLTGYVDASWADGPGRNSTTGYLCYYGENLLGLVDWATKLQDVPAHSTAESELMAADELARNLVWLRTLFKELGIEQKEPTIMHEDNQACIRISEGGGNFSKRKHMDLRYHYLAILVEKKTLVMKHIATNEQVADLLTKPLERNLFQHFVGSIAQDVSEIKNTQS